MADVNSTSKRYTEWPCDNGTVDIMDGREVVFQNLPAEVSRVFVRHDDLVAALQKILAEVGPGFGIYPDDTGTLHNVARIARNALAKVSA